MNIITRIRELKNEGNTTIKIINTLRTEGFDNGSYLNGHINLLIEIIDNFPAYGD